MKSRMIPVLCLLLLFLTACQKQTSDDPIVASYKDTQIHESLVAYEKQNQINVTGDKTVSDADALDQLLLNLIMLDEAEQRGLSVTQEEVDAELAGQRKNYEEYEEVRSYIDDYCTKMGITTEQYFDTVAEQLPRVMLRQRLRDTLGQEYCQQHGLEFTKVNPPEQMTEYVEQYLGRTVFCRRTARRSSITKKERVAAVKRYFRRNRTSVVLFLVSNLLAAVSSVLMSFLLGLFADSAMEGTSRVCGRSRS